MIANRFWPLILMFGTAEAATLPVKPGTYALATVPCGDFPFAAMFDYDGRHFSYPHATHCRSAAVSHDHRLYRIRETCFALGDRSATAPTSTITRYKLLAHDQIAMRQVSETGYSAYRWCPSARANGGS